MRCFTQIVLLCMLYVSSACGFSGGVPPHLHGSWLVHGDAKNEATFELSDREMFITYRSAEISMTPRVTNENVIAFYNLTIHKKPIVWDIKKIMTSLSYISKVNQNGLNIRYALDGDHLEVSWNVSSSLQGCIRLVRFLNDTTSRPDGLDISNDPGIE